MPSPAPARSANSAAGAPGRRVVRTAVRAGSRRPSRYRSSIGTSLAPVRATAEEVMPQTREARRQAMPAASERDKDRPLREDTRLLGRLLGDTVREQQGERVFDVIEQIRQTSIRFRRDEDEGARRELGEIMDGLSRAEASQ